MTTNHGGKRVGAGRKPLHKKSMQKHFVYLPEDIIDKITQHAQGAAISEVLRTYITAQFTDTVTDFERELFVSPRVEYDNIQGHQVSIEGSELLPGFLVNSAGMIVDGTVELTGCAWIVRAADNSFLFAMNDDVYVRPFLYTIGEGNTRTTTPIGSLPDRFADGKDLMEQ